MELVEGGETESDKAMEVDHVVEPCLGHLRRTLARRTAKLTKTAKMESDESPEPSFADSDLRCALCLSIFTSWSWSFEYGVRKPFKWHPNFAQLELSAESGCDICRLIRQAMIYSTSSLEKLVRMTLADPMSLELYYDNTVRIRCNKLFITAVRRVSWELYYPRVTWAPSPDTRQSNIDSVVACIRYWIDKSLSKASLIDPKPTVPLLPTRLLDTGLEDQNQVRLVLGCEAESSDYLALSYCWGLSNDPAKTTSNNINERLTRFPLDTLPLTIRDAVLVTRKLNVRYLWVDAICIIQQTSDSKATDWEQESTKMSQYYRNALCTIAATGSSDSAQGMLSYRPGLRFPVQRCFLSKSPGQGLESNTLYLEPALPIVDVCIGQSPLYCRGWAMQERKLSTRVAHFCRDVVFLEENSTLTSEFGEEPMDSCGGGMSTYNFAGNQWYALVERYTSMQLTYETDRLPAISGIAKETYERDPDDYFAGLWRENLVEGLTWKKKTEPFLSTGNQKKGFACISLSWWRKILAQVIVWKGETEQSLSSQEQKKDLAYIAPSWSWASARTEVAFLTFYDSISDSKEWEWELRAVAKLLDIQVVPAFANQEYGCIRDGMMRISGPVGVLVNNRGSFSLHFGPENSSLWDSITLDITFDEGNEKTPIPTRFQTSMPILCLLIYKEERQSGYFFLILEPVSNTEYRRAGCIVTQKGIRTFSFEEKNPEWKTVTII